jgi:adenylate kinase
MRIVITGTPGTGKSTIAAALASAAGLELVSVTDVARKEKLVGRGHEVDIARLRKALRFLRLKKGYVVEGHLACEMALPADQVVVLRTEPGTLRRRMAKRGYPKEKIEENMMAEMLDYCSQRVRKEYKRTPLELDTTGRAPRACANKILAAIKQKKKKIDSVDYSQALISFLRLHHGRR